MRPARCFKVFHDSVRSAFHYASISRLLGIFFTYVVRRGYFRQPHSTILARYRSHSTIRVLVCMYCGHWQNLLQYPWQLDSFCKIKNRPDKGWRILHLMVLRYQGFRDIWSNFISGTCSTSNSLATTVTFWTAHLWYYPVCTSQLLSQHFGQ